MARTLTCATALRAALRVVLPAGLVALGGCASTDTLYAEYDETMCRVEIASASPVLAAAEPVSVRALIERSFFPWQPAVYFAFNSDALDAENLTRLEGAIEVLARFEDVHVSLQGFTDRIGSSTYNAWLAGRRVGSVRDHLVANGADPGRIVSQPLGEGLPVFGDDDERARAVNRRVELMLLDPDGRPLHPLFDFGATADREPFELPLGAARSLPRSETGTSEVTLPPSPATGSSGDAVALDDATPGPSTSAPVSPLPDPPPHGSTRRVGAVPTERSPGAPVW